MNMQMNVDTQLSVFCNFLQTSMHQAISNAGGARWVRPASQFIGAADATLILASRLSLICENIIKGLGNIFGSVIFTECSMMKGLSQLTWGAGSNICVLPFTACKAGFEFMRSSSLLSIGIFAFVYFRKKQHYEQVVLLERQAAAASAAQRRQQQRVDETRRHQDRKDAEAHLRQVQKDEKIAEFTRLKNQSENDPANGEVWYSLYLCYVNGNGVVPDRTEGIKCLHKAVECGHPDALYVAANLNLGNNEVAEAKALFTRAQNAGHTRAHVKLAELELEYPTASPELETDSSSASSSAPIEATTGAGFYHPRAFELYSILAEDGNIAAQLIVGYMYASGQGVQKDNNNALKTFRQISVLNPAQGSSTYQTELNLVYQSRYFITEICKKYELPLLESERGGKFTWDSMLRSETNIAGGCMSAFANISVDQPPIPKDLPPDRKEILRKAYERMKDFNQKHLIDFAIVKRFFKP